jgi:hypothetical protein
MPEPIFMKLGMFILATAPISSAYFISPYDSVYLYVYHFIVRQRLGKNITAATNTHATVEELLDASFSMWKSRRLVLPRTFCFCVGPIQCRVYSERRVFDPALPSVLILGRLYFLNIRR